MGQLLTVPKLWYYNNITMKKDIVMIKKYEDIFNNAIEETGFVELTKSNITS